MATEAVDAARNTPRAGLAHGRIAAIHRDSGNVVRSCAMLHMLFTRMRYLIIPMQTAGIMVTLMVAAPFLIFCTALLWLPMVLIALAVYLRVRHNQAASTRQKEEAEAAAANVSDWRSQPAEFFNTGARNLFEPSPTPTPTPSPSSSPHLDPYPR